MTLSGKVVFGAPMLVALAIVLVWPERKGLPHVIKNIDRARLWRLVLLEVSAFVFFDESWTVYAYAFPGYSYYYYQKPFWLPDNMIVPFLFVGEFVSVVIFLWCVRRYISSLPPKGSD